MSADELRRRTIEQLSEVRDRSVEYALNVRFRPSAGGDKFVPATTAEEIALQTIEGNAMARAYSFAIEVINDAYRRMHQPDDDKLPEQKRKEVY
jgi:hypothetical protein